jgi:hypothetical protein
MGGEERVVTGYFSDKLLEEIKSARAKVEEQYRDLVLGYSTFPFTNARAREYATHGFTRRLKIVRRCIDNVFRILPSNRKDRPSLDELEDATISIQAFVFNLSGAIDNLAWIWVWEKGVTAKDGSALAKRDVGLGPSKALVRESLSAEFQQYFKTFDKWFDDMVVFRDALAHRIPLYIPPYAMTKDEIAVCEDLNVQMTGAIKRLDFPEYDRLLDQQMQLGTFVPWMQHSFEEQQTASISPADFERLPWTRRAGRKATARARKDAD